MKEFWASFGGQVAATLLPFALVGVVLYVGWEKIFGTQKTVSDVVNNTIDSAATIPSGLESLVGSLVRGESSDTYITQAQAKAEAAAALAANQGAV